MIWGDLGKFKLCSYLRGTHRWPFSSSGVLDKYLGSKSGCLHNDKSFEKDFLTTVFK